MVYIFRERLKISDSVSMIKICILYSHECSAEFRSKNILAYIRQEYK